MAIITELDRIENAAIWRWFDVECEDVQKVHDAWDRRKASRGDRRHVDRKPHRRAYTGPKAIDGTCRNHGSCTWYVRARQHQDRRDRQAAAEQITEWENIEV